MNGLEIKMELLHFGVFSLVQQPLLYCFESRELTPEEQQRSA